MPRRPPASKPKKGTKAANAASDPTHPSFAPTTYAEALDGGVTLEEKGEKFRWSDPRRGRGWYVRAEGVYALARGLGRGEERWDAGYNLARTRYIIATAFDLPPRSLATLRQSLTLYAEALEGYSAVPLRRIDAGFNLAVGLAESADWIEEGLDGQEDETEVRRLRGRAMELLMDVAQVQEAYLRDVDDEGEVGEVDAVPAAADEDSEEGATTYEEHVPTPSALAETLFEIIDVTTSIWASLSGIDSLPPQMTPQAVEQLLDRAMQLAESTADSSLAGMVHVKRLEVALILTKFGAETTLDTPIDQVRGVWQAATAKDSTIEHETRIACAEVLITASTLLAYRATEAQTAWQNLSSATQIATTSLAIPPPLTVSPLASASTLLELATLSLRRTLVAQRFPEFPTAKANAKQLLTNAQVYANRGLKDLGWTAMMTEPVGAVAGAGTLSIGTPTGGGGALPAVTGWDRESLGRTTVLTLLRTFYYQSILLAGEATALGAAQAKADTLMTRLRGLRRTEEEERWITRRDVQRFAEMLEDEEGQVDSQEGQFWKDFVQKLEAV